MGLRCCDVVGRSSFPSVVMSSPHAGQAILVDPQNKEQTNLWIALGLFIRKTKPKTQWVLHTKQTFCFQGLEALFKI